MADSRVRQPADDLRELAQMAIDCARLVGLDDVYDRDLLKLVIAAYGAGLRRAAAEVGFPRKGLLS